MASPDLWFFSDVDGSFTKAKIVVVGRRPRIISLEIPEKNYTFLEVLDSDICTDRGTNQQHHPFIAIEKKSGKVVFIKKLLNVMQYNNVWAIIREIRFFRLHTKKEKPYADLFPELKDIFIPTTKKRLDTEFNNIYLVYDYQDDMISLRYVIRNEPDKVTDDFCRYIVTQLLLILFYLRSRNIIHRDIVPSSLLLEGMKLKLWSFGQSCTADTESKRRRVLVNRPNLEDKIDEVVMKRDMHESFWYTAPETILGCEYSYCVCDMWSAGMVLAEMLGKKILFKGTNKQKQLDLVTTTIGDPSTEYVNCITEDYPDHAKNFKNVLLQRHTYGLRRQPIPFSQLIPDANPIALDLLSSMLKFNPIDRISVEDALKHKYVQELLDSDAYLKNIFDAIKDDIAMDLLTKTLRLNFKDRIKVEETMKHRYVQDLLDRDANLGKIFDALEDVSKEEEEEEEEEEDEEESKDIDNHELSRKILLREKFLFYNPQPTHHIFEGPEL